MKPLSIFVEKNNRLNKFHESFHSRIQLIIYDLALISNEMLVYVKRAI